MWSRIMHIVRYMHNPTPHSDRLNVNKSFNKTQDALVVLVGTHLLRVLLWQTIVVSMPAAMSGLMITRLMGEGLCQSPSSVLLLSLNQSPVATAAIVRTTDAATPVSLKAPPRRNRALLLC